MSDNQQWQAPGAVPPVEATSAPVTPTPPTGWTPPPRPGLIPLRPLELGTILGASFRVLRRNPRPTFGIALLIEGIVSLVTLGVVGVASYFAFSRIDLSSAQDLSTITAGSYGLIAVSAIVPVLLSLVASALLQGIIVLEVSRATLGEKQTVRQLWARGRGRFGALIGYTALVALAGTVVLAAIVGLIVLLVTTLGTVGIVLGVIVGILGGLATLVAFFWISTKLSLVPSALMLERLTIRQAVARSWSLTTGYFWRTLGIELLVSTILNIATQVISVPLSVLGPVVIALTDPNGQGGPTSVVILGAFTILALVVAVVFGAIAAVVQTATTALIYLDIRMRKEGLDLELARFVEARHYGDASVADPYLVAQPAA